MTDTNTPITASLSALIAAGEEIFTAVTGKSSPNVEKVTAGLSAVGDGLLPALESKASFDLARVIAGTTGIFAGIALVLAGLKKKESDIKTNMDETGKNAATTIGQAATTPATHTGSLG